MVYFTVINLQMNNSNIYSHQLKAVNLRKILMSRSQQICSHSEDRVSLNQHTESLGRQLNKVFESFDKDNYWYTGNVRADIIVSIIV